MMPTQIHVPIKNTFIVIRNKFGLKKTFDTHAHTHTHPYVQLIFPNWSFADMVTAHLKI